MRLLRSVARPQASLQFSKQLSDLFQLLFKLEEFELRECTGSFRVKKGNQEGGFSPCRVKDSLRFQQGYPQASSQ